MRRRRGSFPGKRHLLAAIVVGAAAGTLPALASSATEPTVNAVCASECASSFYAKYAWSPSEASIGTGGAVKFANTTPGTPHGIVWSSPLKPSCASSVPVGEGKFSSEEWSGACTFAQPGTYTYYCSVHGLAMSGTVKVSSEPATTTSPTGTTPGTETSPAPPAATTPAPAPPSSPAALLAGPASRALKLARSQHGGRVRGSIALSSAATGGRLEVRLLATRAALASVHSQALLPTGRLVRPVTQAGKVSFAVALTKPARRALAHRHRLALVVKILVTPAHGKPLALTRAIVVHG